MIAVIVVLFWIVGIATGMASTIFLLHLEDAYLYRPARNLIIEITTRFSRIISWLRISFKRRDVQTSSI